MLLRIKNAYTALLQKRYQRALPLTLYQIACVIISILPSVLYCNGAKLYATRALRAILCSYERMCSLAVWRLNCCYLDANIHNVKKKANYRVENYIIIVTSQELKAFRWTKDKIGLLWEDIINYKETNVPKSRIGKDLTKIWGNLSLNLPFSASIAYEILMEAIKSELYENSLHPILRPNKGFLLPRCGSVTKSVTVRRLQCSSKRNDKCNNNNNNNNNNFITMSKYI